MHAIEQHEEVLVPGNEGVKLRVEVLQHGDSDAVLVVGGSCNKKAMKQFVDNSLDV